MCELATVIFCLVKMKSVCLISSFSDKCDTEATLHPRYVYDDSSNKGENSARENMPEILPA